MDQLWQEAYGAKFRPLLAATIDTDEQLAMLDYPVIGSPKLDGIRCLLVPGKGAVSRSLKPIPNKFVRESLEQCLWLDGEIVVGDITNKLAFNNTTSIMAHSGTPDFTYWVFDHIAYPDKPYSARHDLVVSDVEILNDPRIRVLESRLLFNIEEVREYEVECLEKGFEGICIRDMDGAYKFNRSTLKQAILLKMKRFVDEEATIVGFEELHRNTNEAYKDNLGLTKRSAHQENKVPAGMMGKLIVHSKRWGEFAIGSGFDVTLRQNVWNNQSDYLGQTVTFKYQPHGVVEKPRAPIFLRFRPDE